MRALIYSAVGGVLSFILFWFLSNVARWGRDMPIATTILAIIICGCTGIIVEKLDNK